MSVAGHWYVSLIVLAFWVTAILAIVYVARLLFRGSPSSASGGSQRSKALEELDLRYARGEINRAEYLERRTDLGGGSPDAPQPQPPAAKP